MKILRQIKIFNDYFLKIFNHNGCLFHVASVAYSSLLFLPFSKKFMQFLQCDKLDLVSPIKLLKR